MLSSESLKGKIRSLSVSRNLRPQEVLQMYLFERFLDRMSHSVYKNHFVIKGGLLISSIIGIDNRTTMDLDTTLIGLPLKEELLAEMISTICKIDVGDGILFQIKEISPIREQDAYENFRVSLEVTFGKIKNPIRIDITTGDEITPHEIEYHYPCMFQNNPIHVMAYPLETILAEKFEGIIKRNISTTRMRDFYDIYLLFKVKESDIRFDVLKQAIYATAKRRGSLTMLEETSVIIEEMREDSYLKDLWNAYCVDNPYVGELEFSVALQVLKEMWKKVNGEID